MSVNLRKIIEKIESGDNIVLSEAFSEKNIEKVASLIASLLSKESSWKGLKKFSFWYKDQFKSSDGEKGIGFRYISDNGNIIRFAFVNRKTKAKALKDKYSINRVDVWYAGKSTFEKPSYTFTFEPWINGVSAAKEIIAALTGRDVVEGVIISKNAIKENKDFEKILEMNQASQKLIDYALSKGVEYEGESGYKLTKKLIDLGLWDEEEYRGWKKSVGKAEDNISTRQIKAAEKQLAKKKFADPDVVFDDIENLTKVVAMGLQNSLIVAGMAGLGKTFHSKKVLEEMLGKPNTPESQWYYYQGLKASPLGLFRILFENRHDKVIVFDDSDSVWKDPDAVNMLKAALDTYPVREINWVSRVTTNINLLSKGEREEYLINLDKALRDPEKAYLVGSKLKLPSSFEFTSRVIFISNLSADKIDSAIRSRSLFMDIQLTREDVVKRIKSILPHVHPEIPLEQKMVVVDRLAEGEQQLTMRAVIAGLAIQQAGINDWERLVREYT